MVTGIYNIFVMRLWDAVAQALEYCQSTDTCFETSRHFKLCDVYSLCVA